MRFSKLERIFNYYLQNNSASEEEIAKDENVEAGQGDQGDDGNSKKYFYFFLLKRFF